MNAIEDMRARLQDRFRGGKKPAGGFNVATSKPKTQRTPFRPTANDAPRLPQSRVPNPRPRYDRVGRPNKEQSKKPPMYREKPKSMFNGWL